jgi:uncharacterized protein (TIGR00255 family)
MRVDSAAAAYHINKPVLLAYLEQLRDVPLDDEVTRIDLGSLLQLPGVCQEPATDTDDIQRHGDTIRQLTTRAIAKLLEFRQKEGRSLFTELMSHAEVIRASLREISARAPLVIQDYHRKLTARVNELLSKAELKISEPDLLKEVAVFAERADISEEIQRLTHHLEAFEHACHSGEHAGRKLDFITQEMLREANTIASKANDSTIARHIVEIKGAIDRLKEQVQNVE